MPLSSNSVQFSADTCAEPRIAALRSWQDVRKVSCRCHPEASASGPYCRRKLWASIQVTEGTHTLASRRRPEVDLVEVVVELMEHQLGGFNLKCMGLDLLDSVRTDFCAMAGIPVFLHSLQ